MFIKGGCWSEEVSFFRGLTVLWYVRCRQFLKVESQIKRWGLLHTSWHLCPAEKWSETLLLQGIASGVSKSLSQYFLEQYVTNWQVNGTQSLIYTSSINSDYRKWNVRMHDSFLRLSVGNNCRECKNNWNIDVLPAPTSFSAICNHCLGSSSPAKKAIRSKAVSLVCRRDDTKINTGFSGECVLIAEINAK